MQISNTKICILYIVNILKEERDLCIFMVMVCLYVFIYFHVLFIHFNIIGNISLCKIYRVICLNVL